MPAAVPFRNTGAEVERIGANDERSGDRIGIGGRRPYALAIRRTIGADLAIQ